MINIDALAEAHYAKYDPAYEAEEKLEMEKEQIESRAISAFEHAVKQLIWSLDETELHALAENRDALADWIYDVFGEYE